MLAIIFPIKNILYNRLMPKHTADGPNYSWKPSPDIASRKVGDEIVLLNVKTSEYYSVNPTAALVWGLISRNMNLEEIILSVASEFDTDAGKVKKDVMELIKKLEAEKIITRSAKCP
jgi:hypothetical protein